MADVEVKFNFEEIQNIAEALKDYANGTVNFSAKVAEDIKGLGMILGNSVKKGHRLTINRKR